MYVLMCYQTALLTQCLITQFTGVLALTTRYVCVYALSDCSCYCMPYYTHHKHKGAHQCVCVYAASDYSFDCVPYYTHHKQKGAHHYVFMRYQITLLTMPHYTHHKHKGAHQRVRVYDLSDYSSLYASFHTSQT